MRNSAALRWLALCLVVSLGVLAGRPAAAVDRLVLQLKWLPDAQFMGYFAAKEKGFYAAEGLAVTILPGGPGIDPTKGLSNDDADVIVEWMPAALRARERGLDLVNIAQIFQDSGLMLVCRKDRGISKPADLSGRTATVWFNSDEVSFLAWMNHLGIPTVGGASGIKVVEQGGGVQQYFDGSADCVSAMAYNEYWQLIEQGAKRAGMTLFHYEKQGFGVLEDGLYVRQKSLAEKASRDRIIRFLRASLRGWRYAVEHVDEAVQIVVRQIPRLSASHEARVAAGVVKLVRFDKHPLGRLSSAAYDKTVSLLLTGMTKRTVIKGPPQGAWTREVWDAATGKLK